MNSYAHHGAPGVSNALASAFWGIDFMLTTRELRLSAGVNFHGGSTGMDGTVPFTYAPILETSDRVTSASPLFYGMLLVARAGTGPHAGDHSQGWVPQFFGLHSRRRRAAASTWSSSTRTPPTESTPASTPAARWSPPASCTYKDRRSVRRPVRLSPAPASRPRAHGPRSRRSLDCRRRATRRRSRPACERGSRARTIADSRRSCRPVDVLPLLATEA